MLIVWFIGLNIVGFFPKDSFVLHFTGILASTQTSWKKSFVFPLTQSNKLKSYRDPMDMSFQSCGFPIPVVLQSYESKRPIFCPAPPSTIHTPYSTVVLAPRCRCSRLRPTPTHPTQDLVGPRVSVLIQTEPSMRDSIRKLVRFVSGLSLFQSKICSYFASK